MHHVRHKIAKFKGSSCITSKVTAYFYMVTTTIFVNLVQCPCKSLKTENDITSSKINVIEQNLNRERILTELFDLFLEN